MVVGVGGAYVSGSLRLTIFGNITNTTGAPDTFTVRAKTAGVTFATVAPSLAAGITANRAMIEVTLASGNASSAVGYMTVFGQSDVGTSDMGITGDLGAIAFAVTVQWTTRSAGLSFTKSYAIVEWLP